jgi:hypothetical protein
MVLAAGGYLDAAPSTRWFFRTRSRAELGRYLKILGLASAWLGLIIISASAIHFFATLWVVGGLIVAAVIGFFFAGAWTKSPSVQDATP